MDHAPSSLTRVGLYGGSFDPIHLGHLKTAVYVLEHLHLECMYLMPNATPPHKDNLKLPYTQRINMIAAALQDFNDPRLQISFLEQDHTQKHYTYDTLQRFKHDHPQAEVFFVMGMDSFLTLHTWKKHELLIELSNLVVLPRPHYNLKDLLPQIRELSAPYFIDLKTVPLNQEIMSTTAEPAHHHYYLLPAPKIDISSTLIRQLLKKERTSLTPAQEHLLTSTISPSTLHYIDQHQLYH